MYDARRKNMSSRDVAEYVPRLADALIAELLQHAPALLLADPDAALSARRTPLLIDEWQVAPGGQVQSWKGGRDRRGVCSTT